MKSRSCEYCSKHKIKCDLARPCTNCFKRNQRCIYTAESVKSLEQLETRTEEVLRDFETLSPIRGIATQEWTSIINFDDMEEVTIPQEVEDGIGQFFIDMISEKSFLNIPKQTMSKWYLETPLCKECFICISALICPKHLLNGYDAKLASRPYFTRAKQMMMQSLKKQHLPNVFALAMLYAYCRDVGLGAEALNCRRHVNVLATDMKLNESILTPKTQEEHYERCLRINVFWFLWNIDMFAGIFMGQDPLISHEIVKLPLPITPAEFDLNAYNNNRKHREMLEIGISNALGFFPIPFKISLSLSYFLMVKMFSLVDIYTRERKRSRVSYRPDLDYKEAALAGSLFEWEKSRELLRDADMSQQNWRYFANDILYHASIISLYTAKFARQVKCFDDLIKHPTFTSCIKSAQRVSHVVNLMAQNNILPLVHVRYVSHGIFAATAIHEILIREHADLLVAAKAKSDFEINLNALEVLAKTSLPSQIETPKSCQYCFKRKIRCDLAKPCSNCFRRDMKCTYVEFETTQQVPAIDNQQTQSHVLSPIHGITHQDWSAQRVDIAPGSIQISKKLSDCVLEYIADRLSTDSLIYIPALVLIRMAKESLFCMNSICCLTITICPVELLQGQDRKQLAFEFYRRAQQQLGKGSEFQDYHATFAYLMLYMFTRDVGLGMEALNFRRLAIAQILQDGLQFQKAVTQEEHELRCIRVNLMWSIASLDHYASILLGSDPLLEHQQLKIPLPMGKQDFDLKVFQEKRLRRIPLEIGISSAVTFVVIPDLMSQPVSYYLLGKLFSLIEKYFRDRMTSRYTDPQLDYRLGCLEASLQEWNSKRTQIPDASFTSKHWRYFSTDILFHSAIIRLFTAKFLKYGFKNFDQLLQDDKFVTCITSAQRITQIINLFLQHQIFESVIVSRYISRGVFISSAIHEILIREHPDLILVAKAQADFDTNLNGAELLATQSMPSKLEYERLARRKRLLPDFASQLTDFDSLFQFYFQ
ncbi:hypothetical protein EDD86DRAFT_270916 [Gorgonomyces haynaldii]|nr:hypothetical protein EDD86DRAFT_270916 [Gorgonomyces haynaldii]